MVKVLRLRHKGLKKMRNPKLSSPFHPVGILFIGLLMAQILATIQVYQSNLELYATVSAVNAAGYLAPPLARMRPTPTSSPRPCIAVLASQ